MGGHGENVTVPGSVLGGHGRMGQRHARAWVKPQVGSVNVGGVCNSYGQCMCGRMSVQEDPGVSVRGPRT